MIILSRQRYRVAEQLVKGMTNQEIADVLGVGIQNVKGLVSGMMYDTNTSNRVKLVVRLLKEGFESKRPRNK